MYVDPDPQKFVAFHDLVGGFNQPLRKICSSKLGILSPIFGVKIPKIFELPPPEMTLMCQNHLWDSLLFGDFRPRSVQGEFSPPPADAPGSQIGRKNSSFEEKEAREEARWVDDSDILPFPTSWNQGYFQGPLYGKFPILFPIPLP